ncbi:golgin subfamily A member 6-like protein 7 [Diaphorina citri]|jgi:Chromosome segregation ATPases|uniref:Golgin subfamily A member 6-like protein 7 n=1 Tax=Diaphorina citri TaxID=121845 RepID=A0A3Q0IKI8_DIACI|nr:golgin subfamily A member 6-like protein 7 [Diaphorina citri]KAI5755398.1 hypothetical protein M8J77_016464 [Diaphorina citri]
MSGDDEHTYINKIRSLEASLNLLRNENTMLTSEIEELRRRLQPISEINHYEQNQKIEIDQHKYENEKLQKDLKQKDETMVKMKKEFETFMDKICAQNKKLERSMHEKEEKVDSTVNKIKQQNVEYKKHIEHLEEELLACRKQMAEFLTSLDLERYKKNIQEKDLELKRNEKKIEVLTDRMKNMKESHEYLIEENEQLKESLERVKLNVNRAELDIIEYCREIKKYDDMVVAIEKQLARYQTFLFKLQDQVRKNNLHKSGMEEQLEKCVDELLDEKEYSANLEKELTDAKAKNKLYAKCLDDCQKKLDENTRELACYKENIGFLKENIEAKRRSLSISKPRDCVRKNFTSCGDFQEQMVPELTDCQSISDVMNIDDHDDFVMESYKQIIKSKSKPNNLCKKANTMMLNKIQCLDKRNYCGTTKRLKSCSKPHKGCLNH